MKLSNKIFSLSLTSAGEDTQDAFNKFFESQKDFNLVFALNNRTNKNQKGETNFQFKGNIIDINTNPDKEFVGSFKLSKSSFSDNIEIQIEWDMPVNFPTNIKGNNIVSILNCFVEHSKN